MDLAERYNKELLGKKFYHIDEPGYMDLAERYNKELLGKKFYHIDEPNYMYTFGEIRDNSSIIYWYNKNEYSYAPYDFDIIFDNLEERNWIMPTEERKKKLKNLMK